MRKRILLCACHQCQLAMPYARCLWRGKRLQCGRHNVVDVFQTGTYVTARRQPRPPRLTRAMKDFAKEMADQGLKPARIRSGLLRKFELCTSSLPSLKVVQRFVNNYKSTQLGGNDYLDDLRNMVRESTFTGHEQEFNDHSGGTVILEAPSTRSDRNDCTLSIQPEPILKADLIWEKVLMWTHFSSESRPKRFSVRQIANQQLLCCTLMQHLS
ncbi:hypothetical protein F441_18085 [Phytophthora nicotianae CJ01A1]|uniref:Uncharacterized protein n=1 Tax=Phytophthora nicotianae CJ01A1 TaxID=1317063 RepID=W2W3Z0_PHYNI|nr:hypothetical protein F441_18085 [Phytophthora nicotianae CJ01A1]